MRKKPLDMIPFVDIMIVVLFIFATIEEGEHEASEAPEKVAELEKENERLNAELAKLGGQKRTAELERDELSKAVEASKDQIDQSLEARRKNEVIGALLGEAQVIEVEIEGEPGAEDTVNRCCFRRFSLKGEWKTCGVVPNDPDERTRWLDDGAGGLLTELNATGATPTMVLIRQEKDAAYNISDKLGEQVRGRTPIKKTYSITVDTPVERCVPAGGPAPAPAPSSNPP